MRLHVLVVGVALALVAGGCGDDDDNGGTTDTKVTDTRIDDTGGDTQVADTLRPDTLQPDTVQPDTLQPDTTPTDTFTEDTNVTDTTITDTFGEDTNVSDTGPEDTSGDTADTNVADTADTNGGSGCATDLFFSEYVEGSSDNKALEIANFTGEPVNLADYEIQSLGNVDKVPAPTWDANGSSVTLPAVVLPSGATYVICNAGIADEIKPKCDVLVGGNVGPFAPTPIYFNGNDARALAKGGTRIDVIGQDDVPVGGDKGWTVAGVANATFKHTLVRLPTVTSPTTDWAASAASQWQVRDVDDVSDLGTHTFGFTCTPIAAAADVVINEVVAAASESGPDTIELYNNSDAAVDLAGWTLDNTGSAAGGTTFAIATGTTIPAHGFALFTGGTDFTFDLGAADSVVLRDDADVLADATAWQDGDAPEGKSWGRAPDGTGDFRTLQSVTPGAANDVTECGNDVCEASETCGSCAADCGACAAVKVNEVLFASADANPAFVELYNADTVTADISGWSLITDGGDSYIIPANTTVDAGAYLVLDATTTGFAFSDSDGVALTDNGGVELNGTTWTGLAVGSSWGRVPDGTGAFTQLAAPSPGAVNVSAGGPQGCATDLFFSEYVEGSSFNKALEIANFTGASVDLSQYEILGGLNGGSYTANYGSALTGTIANGDVYLICHSSIDATFLALGKCDITASSNFMGFNGNDARALAKVSTGGGEPTIIDVIGLTTGDPSGGGWDVAGVTAATKDHTIRRKGTVTTGNPDWTASQATEWDVLDKDTLDGLGSHAYGGTCP